jgi:hypothetical protein
MNGREHTSRFGLLVAVALFACVFGVARLANRDEAGQSRAAALQPVAFVAASSPTPALSMVAGGHTAAVVPDPSWPRLSLAQRQALAPLEQVWPTLSESARRRWLVIAASFQSKSRAIQDRMHARMVQWSKLSSSQRAEARLRYLQTAKLDARSKRERWEAYKKTEPDQHRPTHASHQIEVVAPLSVRARPGATTMLMSQLVARTQTTDTGSH